MKKINLKKFTIYCITGLLLVITTPLDAFAAGISPSGGGKFTVGQTFTISVRATGAEFDSLQGSISISGPVDVVSFSGGSATWLPGKSPSNGGQFVGIVSPTSSLTVATIKLRGKSIGSGAVSVGAVKLARNGSYVGTSGGSTSFTIGRAPTPPGGVAVSSSTHPDQTISYDATTVVMSWTAPSNGASGYSYVWDAVADTTPTAKSNSTTTTATFDNQPIGTYYFHIRANNSDGWGATTHYKVTIKEPDAKIDSSITGPSILSVVKSANFLTDVTKGTISGFTINGTGGLAGYTVNLVFDPKGNLPAELFVPVATTVSAEKTDKESVLASPAATPASAASIMLTPLQATPNADGSWQMTVNYPIPSGFYKLVAQGQKDKVLTPTSQDYYIELSVANGGSVKLITTEDLPKAAVQKTSSGIVVLGVHFSKTYYLWLTVAGLVIVAGLIIGFIVWLKRRIKKHRSS